MYAKLLAHHKMDDSGQLNFEKEKKRILEHEFMTPGRKSYRIARLWTRDLTPGWRRRKIIMSMLWLIRSFFQRQY